jgi:hypothetical protein
LSALIGLTGPKIESGEYRSSPSHPPLSNGLMQADVAEAR